MPRDPESNTVHTVDSFEHFPALGYLEKYYSYVGEENRAMMRALAHFTRRFAPSFDQLIEVGGGPSILPILVFCAATARSPRSIAFADIAPGNLAEVKRWLKRQPTRFNYASVLEWLSKEHRVKPGQIEHLARASDWMLSPIDLKQPLPTGMVRAFDTVSSHFFAESATSDRNTLLSLLGRLAELGKPDACVLLSFMRRSLGYSIGGLQFPAIAVDENTLPGMFYAAGLHLADVEYLVTDAETPPTRPGYEGMVFVAGILQSGTAMKPDMPGSTT